MREMAQGSILGTLGVLNALNALNALKESDGGREWHWGSVEAGRAGPPARLARREDSAAVSSQSI